jgi:hypothetical protein
MPAKRLQTSSTRFTSNHRHALRALFVMCTIFSNLFFFTLFVNAGLALTGEQSQGKKGGSTCQVEDGFV